MGFLSQRNRESREERRGVGVGRLLSCYTMLRLDRPSASGRFPRFRFLGERRASAVIGSGKMRDVARFDSGAGDSGLRDVCRGCQSRNEGRKRGRLSGSSSVLLVDLSWNVEWWWWREWWWSGRRTTDRCAAQAVERRSPSLLPTHGLAGWREGVVVGRGRTCVYAALYML